MSVVPCVRPSRPERVQFLQEGVQMLHTAALIAAR